MYLDAMCVEKIFATCSVWTCVTLVRFLSRVYAYMAFEVTRLTER